MSAGGALRFGTGCRRTGWPVRKLSTVIAISCFSRSLSIPIPALSNTSLGILVGPNLGVLGVKSTFADPEPFPLERDRLELLKCDEPSNAAALRKFSTTRQIWVNTK